MSNFSPDIYKPTEGLLVRISVRYEAPLAVGQIPLGHEWSLPEPSIA